MRDVIEFIVRGAASDSAVDRGESSGTGDVGSGFSGCMAWEWQ